MYGLYDKNGMLRFVNAEKDACLDYAELFELNSSHFCLMNLIENVERKQEINLVLNQEERNN